MAAYIDREFAMDFTQAAITAGFRGRRVLSVLLLPLAVGLFRPEGVPDAWVYLWPGNLLNLWWLGCLLYTSSFL